MQEKSRKLSDIQCFLMDMDGTIYLGDRLLPGAREWLDCWMLRGSVISS
jgi:ribonucleotide monophosphatase NagD (HAD superfamily)